MKLHFCFFLEECTGTPKLIPRTHADYIYNSVTAALKCKVTEKSVYLSILPIAHNFSLSSPGLLGVLGKGGTVVMAHQEAQMRYCRLSKRKALL